MTAYLDNLLGAVSLAVTDAVTASAAAELELGGEAAGALVLIGLRPGMSVKRLAERLRLSHPGAVRLAERLREAGWLKRAAGEDKRVVRLSLTKEGARMLARLRRVRARRLAQATGALTAQEQRMLAPILEKLAMRLTQDRVDAYANFRLCDTPACEAQGCPVEKQARAIYARHDPE